MIGLDACGPALASCGLCFSRARSRWRHSRCCPAENKRCASFKQSRRSTRVNFLVDPICDSWEGEGGCLPFLPGMSNGQF